MNRNIKEFLKKDKAMLNCFADVINYYKNNIANESKDKTTKEFLSENPDVGLNAFVLLKTKDFYHNKDTLSDDFYKEMLISVVDDLSKVQGVKKPEVVLDNKVGFENKPFKTLQDVINECKRSKEFVHALETVHAEYNKGFSRNNPLNEDLKSTSMNMDMLTIANIVKENVYYDDKDILEDAFYDDMVESAIKKTNDTFFPEEVIPYLKPEQKIIEEIDTQAFDETRRELSESWEDARRLFQEGKNLSTEYNPVLSKKDSNEQFWNGHRSTKTFLK